MGSHVDPVPIDVIDGEGGAPGLVLRQPEADRSFIVRARYQTFGLAVLGLVCCASAGVFARWSSQHDPGRWFWLCVGTVASVICLIRSQRTHGGNGADRDASPYYGIFAGATSGALLLTVLPVDGWILPAVFVVVAAVLALMAWIEQSAIGVTAAVCVAVLSIGSGLSSLDDSVSVAAGSLAVGLMLLVAAGVLAMVAGGDAG